MSKTQSGVISALINVRRLLFAIAISTLIIGCGGGSSGGTDTGGTDTGGNAVSLSSLAFRYSDTPTQNQEITVSLIADEDIGEVDWEVTSQPSSANLSLNESTDNKSVTFTASESGDYEIVARSVSNSSEKATTFSISPVFAFDESKIEGNDGSVNLDELIGIIQNQAWVYSASLTETQLRDIVLNYSNLTIIGYDPIEGLLVEFDDTDISTKESLEILKLEEGVSSVENRVYEGENAPTELELPIDGAGFGQNDWSDTSGANWHLELINAEEAWNYTTGSNNLFVGVVDSGFFNGHEDIAGRFEEILTSKNSSHGMGVVGVISSNTDNSLGVSAINWDSNLIAGAKSFFCDKKCVLKDIAKKSKDNIEFKVINISQSMTGYPPVDFDPSNAEDVNERKSLAEKRASGYAKIANAYKDKLFVYAAGNGIGNGAGNADGVYGVDAQFHNGAIHLNKESVSKLGNAIVVGAVVKDQRDNASADDVVLWALSEYGNTVDIVAPTRFASLSDSASGYYLSSEYASNNSSGGSFSGTSAAAPVVTGVASLVYSLYPGFTGKEVKDILIDSATESVSERYIAPGGAGQNNSNIEALAHSIPILNAEKALEKAQEIIDSKVTASDSIPDPFTAQARIVFNSIDDNLEVVGIEWELQSTTDGGTTWNYVNGMSVNGDLIFRGSNLGRI